MLKKLLKYDLRFYMAWSRFLWPAMILSAVLFVVMGRLSVVYDSTIVELLAMLPMITTVILSFVSQVSVYVRYYKNVATDEAYLTFTLPASRKEILLSKTLFAIIEGALRFLFFMLVIIACVVFIPDYSDPGTIINVDNLRFIREALASLWSILGFWLIPGVVVAILLLTVITAFGNAVVFLAITFGAMTAQKSRIIVTLGVLYLTNLLSSYILPFVLVIPMMTVAIPLIEKIIALPSSTASAAMVLSELLICLIMTAIAGILYFINLGILERKLNLQ